MALTLFNRLVCKLRQSRPTIPQDAAKSTTESPLPYTITIVPSSHHVYTQLGRAQETLEAVAFNAAFASAITTTHAVLYGRLNSHRDIISIVDGIEAGTKAGIAAVRGRRGKFLRWWPQGHHRSNTKGTAQEELVAYYASSAAAISSARGALQEQKDPAFIVDAIEKSVAVGVAAGIAAATAQREKNRGGGNPVPIEVEP
ncbi:hypothetical protein B0T25DRAFT_553672 [Lasiosphaeria hispida]|uniref:Uncharacterized protein n=1 Tax=Lasiosphaeria hispida TaxID=260671 RepID=A0AAJ0MBF6_9PEZI|nr:hypothetical protein B0T25DRAFT_553672 [Lasiosphaeria hispida]